VNKSELIDSISEAADISKVQAQKVLEAVLESIGQALSKEDTVTLVGFGSFSVKTRSARQGRNPKTGEPMTIKESKTPMFKPGKGLKDLVNRP
jgi:DNA-binding protein HU-beta